MSGDIQENWMRKLNKYLVFCYIIYFTGKNLIHTRFRFSCVGIKLDWAIFYVRFAKFFFRCFEIKISFKLWLTARTSILYWNVRADCRPVGLSLNRLTLIATLYKLIWTLPPKGVMVWLFWIRRTNHDALSNQQNSKNSSKS